MRHFFPHPHIDSALAITAGLNVTWPLLAQAIDLDKNVIQLIGNGVTIAVLVWYVIFDVRTRTPKMMKVFQEEQALQRKLFTDQEKENRDYYRHTVTEIRNAFMEEQRAQREEQRLQRVAFAEENGRMRASYDKDISELRTMLYQTMKDMRGAVHDVKDTVVPITTRLNIAELERKHGA